MSSVTPSNKKSKSSRIRGRLQIQDSSEVEDITVLGLGPEETLFRDRHLYRLYWRGWSRGCVRLLLNDIQDRRSDGGEIKSPCSPDLILDSLLPE